MAIVVADTIDLIQALNAQVSGVESAPSLENYPPNIEDARLPLALTRKEAGEFLARGSGNQSDDTYVVQIFFESIFKGEYGYTLQKGHDLLDQFRTTYLTESNYAQTGANVLQKSPYRIEIVPPFSDTGMTVIEWPLGTDRWWHGFELRFTVQTDDWSC